MRGGSPRKDKYYLQKTRITIHLLIKITVNLSPNSTRIFVHNFDNNEDIISNISTDFPYIFGNVLTSTPSVLASIVKEPPLISKCD